MSLWNASTLTLSLDAMPCKPRHACAVKPEVLKSWSLEIDYSRAPGLGAEQKARGLWQRDCKKSILIAYFRDSGKRNFYIRDPLFFPFVNYARDHSCM